MRKRDLKKIDVEVFENELQQTFQEPHANHPDAIRLAQTYAKIEIIRLSEEIKQLNPIQEENLQRQRDLFSLKNSWYFSLLASQDTYQHLPLKVLILADAFSYTDTEMYDPTDENMGRLLTNLGESIRESTFDIKKNTRT